MRSLGWPMIGATLCLTLMLPHSAVAQQVADSGRLVIVGGALRPETEMIYRAVLEGLDGDETLGVVPLASGVPERSGPLTAEDFQQYAEPADHVVNLERFIHTDLDYAASPDAGEALLEHGGLWFTGGDQSRITAALRPRGADTEAYGALLTVLEEGGTVGGTSAGAAMMSDPMIRSGQSADALMLGATDIVDGPGVCVGQGVGLFPFGLVDQHFLRRGRFGRLLVALEATQTPVGFGVSENRGVLVDRATGRITTLGDQAVTVIDLREAQRDGHARQNVRVHLLGSGDVVDGLTYAVTPGTGKRALGGHSADTGVSITFPDMWDRYVVAEMIKALAANPARPVLSQDDAFEYQMSADEQTVFYVGEADDGLTAVAVRLDITPREGIEDLIAERRQELTEAASE